MGNLASVKNAFAKCGEDATVITSPDDIHKYNKIILPGVGAFGDAMKHLRSSGFDKSIVEFASNGGIVLGICLGMQLLFDSSDEFGDHSGLGLIPGVVRYFDISRFENRLKIPHMGWNQVDQKDDVIFTKIPQDVYLYFVHSYHVICDEQYIIGSTEYGYRFPSVVKRRNIYGIQPHPEKSHDNGVQIIQNFINL